MPRISYVDPSTLDDSVSQEILERARLHGTPRPESQSVRAHVPEILRTFTAYWNATFEDGLVDNRLKELCRLYVSKTVECSYCGGQRSEAARAQGLSEDLVDEILLFESSGSFVSLTAGAQRWVKTLDLGHREVLGDTTAGLASTGAGT